jgi:protein-S-isoprenylcysteine O-methyltransferase Ste14
MQGIDWIAATAFFGMMASWIGFGAVFLIRKRPPKARETKRDKTSYWGIGLQAIGFWIVWFFMRPFFSPIVPMPRAAEIVVTALTIAIGAASVWLSGAAVRTLGKQWTYQARVVEGHELITQGPYSLVRNPIYLGMFGMLLTTGLAVGRWPVLLAAIVIFLIGIEIRIRAEEKLLREAFGEKFDEYARRVPALIPHYRKRESLRKNI